MKEQLLRLFEQYPDRYISGEEISEKLQCSRTAVWKQIQRLKQKGYRFSAKPRLGYRLTAKPARLDLNLVSTMLRTKSLGRNIHFFEQLDSTQTSAHQLANESVPEGTVVIAESQSAGRGRMGRSWHSPAGKGIWMSIILRPEIPLPFAPQLTLLVSIALCRTIRRKFDLPAGIKWPNDILINGKKMCGVLLESSVENERLRYVIAGVGISVNLDSEDFPEALRNTATSIKMETGREAVREAVLAEFLNEFEQLYDLFRIEGFSPIRSLWETLNITLNGEVRIKTGGEWIEGTAKSIDEFGALLVVRKDGKQVKCYSNDE